MSSHWLAPLPWLAGWLPWLALGWLVGLGARAGQGRPGRVRAGQGRPGRARARAGQGQGGPGPERDFNGLIINVNAMRLRCYGGC